MVGPLSLVAPRQETTSNQEAAEPQWPPGADCTCQDGLTVSPEVDSSQQSKRWMCYLTLQCLSCLLDQQQQQTAFAAAATATAAATAQASQQHQQQQQSQMQ